MTTINLKDFYYWYTQDQFIEVSDEVAEVFVSDARHEMAYQRRLSRHKAQYSLDCDDGIEYSAVSYTHLDVYKRQGWYFKIYRPKHEKAAVPEEDYSEELADYDDPEDDTESEDNE